METRARRTIAELIKPIVHELEQDRRNVAQVCSNQDRINSRLNNIEFAMGLNDARPKVFEEIENKFADFKCDIAEKHNDAIYRVGLCDNRIEVLDRDMRSALADIRTMDNLLKLRDDTIKETKEIQVKLKLETNERFAKIERDMAELKGRTKHDLNNFDQRAS